VRAPVNVLIRFPDGFKPNPLFDANARRSRERVRPSHDGIAKQLTTSPSDEADIVLGLDFGTAVVKAVIQDHTSGRAFAVPFTADIGDEYFLPSRLFDAKVGYSLDVGLTQSTDMKLALMECPARLPVQEFDEACAFLALVIRHCRGWFLSRYGALYANHALNWSINLGLPARTYENQSIVKLFRRVGWAAANLAADSKCANICRDALTTYRQLSLMAYGNEFEEEGLGDFEFLPSDVDVIPEIAAQVYGFVKSASWDHIRQPRFLLVDIGAGTVDSAFFAVRPSDQEGFRFVFYSADVKPLGVLNLHRSRLDWLKAAEITDRTVRSKVHGYLGSIGCPKGSWSRIPEHVQDYLPDAMFSIPNRAAEVDYSFFFGQLLPQVAGCFVQGKVEQQLHWADLAKTPIFVCGGGSRMQFFRAIPNELNKLMRCAGSVEIQPLPIPPRFVAPGLSDADYDRLSVAYGLSSQGASGRKLGAIVRAADVPPVRQLKKHDLEDRFVSKDHV
jgi:hypothetical protein